LSRSKLLASSELESESDTEVRPKKRSNLSDEDGSDSEVRSKKKSADSSDDESIVDSEEGEDEPRRSYNSDENEHGGEGGPVQNQKKKKGENRQSRKSKDQALKEIYSESNRMLRESKVSL
jgi:hypothetical protein